MKTLTPTRRIAPSFLTFGFLTFGALALTPAMANAAEKSAPKNSECEIVLMQTIADESGRGGAQIASYRPAEDFLISVYQEDTDPIMTINEKPIQAIMCKRVDVIPTKNDFPIVATGIPFFLSQSFESQDTDLVSVYYKDGAFRHNYKGPGLSEEATTLLEKRLAMFGDMKAQQDK